MYAGFDTCSKEGSFGFSSEEDENENESEGTILSVVEDSQIIGSQKKSPTKSLAESDNDEGEITFFNRLTDYGDRNGDNNDNIENYGEGNEDRFDDDGSVRSRQESEKSESEELANDEEDLALESLYPPITNRAARERYIDDHEADYPTYIDLYNRFRAPAMEILSIRDQLRTLPSSQLNDNGLRNRLVNTLKRKYSELGYQNEDAQSTLVRYLKLSKKIKLIKHRVNQYDQAFSFTDD